MCIICRRDMDDKAVDLHFRCRAVLQVFDLPCFWSGNRTAKGKGSSDRTSRKAPVGFQVNLFGTDVVVSKLNTYPLGKGHGQDGQACFILFQSICFKLFYKHMPQRSQSPRSPSPQTWSEWSDGLETSRLGAGRGPAAVCYSISSCWASWWSKEIETVCVGHCLKTASTHFWPGVRFTNKRRLQTLHCFPRSVGYICNFSM